MVIAGVFPPILVASNPGKFLPGAEHLRSPVVVSESRKNLLENRTSYWNPVFPCRECSEELDTSSRFSLKKLHVSSLENPGTLGTVECQWTPDPLLPLKTKKFCCADLTAYNLC
ncbi:serine-rich and transmembrane domain-containing protein 1 isoform X2 [Halichoerus grypus]|uniref:serine-rich and transmembrane domain-containing protein 1 isoform X3 n=1 Tax=Halichoerus grypus TaxID=9711 RepID=UPI001658FC91|nr:serine-rich and transmembrane domain-containing protein 1 isoform X3 [Halichoerus grypus]